MKNSNTSRLGFTLIELLVVVLIVGILAAVAIAQYQKAVAKSRMAEGISNLKTLVQISDAYYMANGKRPLDFTELDISFAGASFLTAEGHENSKISLPNGWTYVLDEDGYIEAINSQYASYPGLVYMYRTWGSYTTPLTCRAKTNNAVGRELCKAVGGVETGTNNDYTVYAMGSF